MIELLLIPAAYLVGAIPWAYLLSKAFKQVDVRTTGTGNVGTMNTFWHVGYLPGILTLILDVGKGFLVAWLALRFLTHPGLVLAAMLLCILGHNYNLFLGFRGGKGLACLIGLMLPLSPLVIVIVLAANALLFLVLKDINTATAAALWAVPVTLTLQFAIFPEGLWGLALLFPIWSRHLKDLRAYRQGRRQGIQEKTKK